jgi:hypothetical protein
MSRSLSLVSLVFKLLFTTKDTKGTKDSGGPSQVY